MDHRLIRQNLIVKGNENIFVDLGAQVGRYSQFFYTYYNTQCKKIISVEPMKENCDKIQELIQGYNAQEKWVIDQCAVSISDGEMMFPFHRTGHNEPLGSFNLDEIIRKKDYASHDESAYASMNVEHEMVKLKTMRNICPNPDIIKIDIEGYEYPILPEILRMNSVYALIIEFGQMPYPAREKEGYLLEDYLSMLYQRGFTDMVGHTEAEGLAFYFIPNVTPELRWEDIPGHPFDQGFHVLAQRHTEKRLVKLLMQHVED